MIQPLHKDILLHPIEQPSMKGKLYLPDAYKKRPVKGIIVCKGPACEDSELAVGDVVIVSAYAGEKITLEDEGIFWIIQEDDIVAKLHAEPKIRLVDTETMRRIVQEVCGEIMSYIGRDLRDGVCETKSKIIDRLNDLTQNEGFEF